MKVVVIGRTLNIASNRALININPVLNMGFIFYFYFLWLSIIFILMVHFLKLLTEYLIYANTNVMWNDYVICGCSS